MKEVCYYFFDFHNLYYSFSLCDLHKPPGLYLNVLLQLLLSLYFIFRMIIKYKDGYPDGSLVKTEAIYARAKERVAQHGVRGARPRLGDTRAITNPIFSSKRTIFLHARAICSELPSKIRSMV